MPLWRRGTKMAGPASAAETGRGEAAPAEPAMTRAEQPVAPAGAGQTGYAASPRERRRTRRRARNAAGATVGALGSGALLLARRVMTVASLIALLIVLAIVLRDVGANSSNSIVEGVHEGANFFAGAFTGLIAFSGHPKRAITVDWGIAALVYLLAGALISRTIGAVGRGGLRFERRHRAVPLH